MSRVLLLVLANFAIPFVLFYIRNIIYKVYYLKYKKDITKQVPKLDIKMSLKLIFTGIVLLTSVLITLRINEPLEKRLNTNKVHQENYR